MKTVFKRVFSISVLPLIAVSMMGCQNNSEEGNDGNADGIRSVAPDEVNEELERTLGESPDDFVNKAIRTDSGEMMLVLYGSSSCPPVPEDVYVTEENILSVHLSDEHKGKACTADIGPHGYLMDPFKEDAVITTGEVVMPTGEKGSLNVYGQTMNLPDRFEPSEEPQNTEESDAPAEPETPTDPGAPTEQESPEE